MVFASEIDHQVEPRAYVKIREWLDLAGPLDPTNRGEYIDGLPQPYTSYSPTMSCVSIHLYKGPIP